MIKVIIGIGNRHRGDDRIGLEIIERLRILQHPLLEDWRLLSCEGELLGLIDLIGGCSHVIIIDGLMDAGAVPGSIQQWDLVRENLPSGICLMSTHSMGLRSLVDLVRILGKVPHDFWLIGVVLGDCRIGSELSPNITNSIDSVMHQILDLVVDV